MVGVALPISSSAAVASGKVLKSANPMRR